MNSKYKAKSKFFWRRNFYHLDAPPEYWRLSVAAHKRICNGVGSRVGWWRRFLWHLTPNTVWFLSIEQSADVHDYDYSFPQHFRSMSEACIFKSVADNRFRENCFRQIELGTKNEYLKYLRRIRIEKYHLVLTEAGMDSFLAGKTVGQ